MLTSGQRQKKVGAEDTMIKECVRKLVHNGPKTKVLEKDIIDSLRGSNSNNYGF